MIRNYSPSDLYDIKEWHFKRGCGELREDLMPRIGYIEPRVAVGFIILMDNNCATFDFYISNPDANKPKRNIAFDEITSALIEDAKKLNIKMLFCNSKFETIKARAKRHGFTETGEFTGFKREI